MEKALLAKNIEEIKIMRLSTRPSSGISEDSVSKSQEHLICGRIQLRYKKIKVANSVYYFLFQKECIIINSLLMASGDFRPMIQQPQMSKEI